MGKGRRSKDGAIDPAIQRSFKGHRGTITGVAFNPNMRQLATSSTDKAVMLWNFKPQLRAFRFEGHSDEVLSVAYSSANSFVASGSKDRTARLWIPTVYALGPLLHCHHAFFFPTLPPYATIFSLRNPISFCCLHRNAIQCIEGI